LHRPFAPEAPITCWHDNKATLAQDVRLFFEAATLPVYETTDGGHGRIEVRRHQVIYDVGRLTGDRRFPGEPRFPDLAMVARIEAEVERNGQTTTARRYYLSSAKLEPAQFARAVRAHWGIENRLHWVMDVVFYDDLMLGRKLSLQRAYHSSPVIFKRLPWERCRSNRPTF
jgi:hypothetical protein